MAAVKIASTLEQLDMVVSAMRKRGVVQWTDSPVGGLTLGPDPARVAKLEKKEADPLEKRRSHYSDLLGRNVSDSELAHLP